jgi:hypothetical protein
VTAETIFSETLMRRVVMIQVIMFLTKRSSHAGHWPRICCTEVNHIIIIIIIIVNINSQLQMYLIDVHRISHLS